MTQRAILKRPVTLKYTAEITETSRVRVNYELNWNQLKIEKNECKILCLRLHQTSRVKASES